MRTKIVLVVTAAGLLAGVFGAQSASAAPARSAGPAVAVTPVVVIAGFTYLPPNIVATANSRISVINADGRTVGIPHTLTGPGFNTGQFTGGVKVIRAPKNRGVYLFRCTLHPFMRGALVVVR